MMSGPVRRLRALAAGRGAALLSVLDQGLVSGFGFLLGILAARLTGVEEFGRLALILIAAAFAQGLHNALVAQPMMTLAGTRARAAALYDASLLVGAALLCGPMAAGVALVLGAVAASRGEALPFGAMAAAAALTVAQNLQFTLRRMLFARGRGGRALAMDALRALVFLAALAACLGGARLAGARLDAEALTWLLAAAALASALPFAWPLCRPVRRRGRGRPRLAAVAGRHWHSARWLLPVVFVTFGQEQLVWIIVGAVLGDDALGGLRAAQYLVGLVLLVLAATENLVPTAAGRAYAGGGEAGLRGYLVRVTAALGLLVAALLLVVAVPAEAWLRLVFGEAFVPYAASVRLLALGAAFIFLRDMAAHFFRATQRTGVIFQAFAASLAVSLAALGPLLERGVAGAALVVVIGHAASMAYLLAAAAWRGVRAGSRTEPRAGPAPGEAPSC